MKCKFFEEKKKYSWKKIAISKTLNLNPLFSSKRKNIDRFLFFIDLSSDWNWTKTKLDEARQCDRARRQCDEDNNLINKLVLLDFCISTFPSSFRIRSFKKCVLQKYHLDVYLVSWEGRISIDIGLEYITSKWARLWYGQLHSYRYS